MAVNEAYLEAAPQHVWAVLSDPYAYPRWVVGSKETVEADPSWPLPGSEFRVKVGAGVAGADVEIVLSPSGTGTVVTMEEKPGGFSAPLRSIVPLQWVIKVRNVESLRRLKRIAEARCGKSSPQP